MNIKVDFDNIIVKEEKSDTLVKVLMLKGEKGEAGATNWGAITGTLSNQTDLKNALDGKANQSDFNTVSGQVNTNTSNISTINGQITDINGELDDFEDLFYGNATVNDENTSITLENTVEAKFEKIDLKGNTSQTGTPTPTNPIPVNVVSGDNEINVCGKNLFYGELEQGSYDNGTGTKQTNTGLYRNSDYISVQPSTTYTFSIDGVSQKYVLLYYQSNKTFISVDTSLTTGTFTTPNNCYYINFRCFGTDYTSDYDTLKIQLEKSSSASNYEVKGNTYNIDLPSGMELCKIGTYQDYIYKDSDKWYLYKAIGKVVLNGSETTWARADGNDNYRDFRIPITNIALANSEPIGYIDNRFVAKTSSYWNENAEHLVQMNDKRLSFRIAVSRLTDSTRESWIAWLTNNHITTYYGLETPTTTEITDTTLISQLNALEQATSKNGETNISQVNDDLPFIIYAEAFANTFNGRMEGMDYKIDNCEVLNNKVTSITSGSTDSEYPSAKAVYDLFNSITDGDEVSY